MRMTKRMAKKIQTGAGQGLDDKEKRRRARHSIYGDAREARSYRMETRRMRAECQRLFGHLPGWSDELSLMMAFDWRRPLRSAWRKKNGRVLRGPSLVRYRRYCLWHNAAVAERG
jgi:hypothetical protein